MQPVQVGLETEVCVLQIKQGRNQGECLMAEEEQQQQVVEGKSG